MAIYSCGFRTVTTTASTYICQITSSATDRPKILEIGVTLATATACTIGLGKPATAGTTATTSYTVQAEDYNELAGTCVVATVMTTAPTAPGTYFRRTGLPATIGAGIVWTFPRGINVGTSGALILYAITAVPLLDVWVVVDE